MGARGDGTRLGESVQEPDGHNEQSQNYAGDDYGRACRDPTTVIVMDVWVGGLCSRLLHPISKKKRVITMLKPMTSEQNIHCCISISTFFRGFQARVPMRIP